MQTFRRLANGQTGHKYQLLHDVREDDLRSTRHHKRRRRRLFIMLATIAAIISLGVLYV